jgi:hypothetical protein
MFKPVVVDAGPKIGAWMCWCRSCFVMGLRLMSRLGSTHLYSCSAWQWLLPVEHIRLARKAKRDPDSDMVPDGIV